MGEILAGEATPAQIAGFAVALRAKGETIDEVTALVDGDVRRAPPRSRSPGRLLDVVGTGGDRSMSVNISTMAAIVAAGAGRPGGQARQPLGVLDVRQRRRARGARHPARPAARRVAAVADEAGITFCFAAAFHPAMRHAAVPRRELGIATTFNFLGPLTNPTRPAAQAIGCADPRLAPVMAGVFAAPRRRRLGVPRRRRARRADHHHHLVGVDRARRRGHRGKRRPGRLRHRAGDRRGPAGRRHGAQRRRRPPAARRRAGRRARRRTPQRGCGARGATTPRRRRVDEALAAGIEQAARGRRLGCRDARRSTAGSPRSAHEGRTRSSTYDDPSRRKPCGSRS